MKKINYLRCCTFNNLQTSTLIKNSWFSWPFPVLFLTLTLGINTAAADTQISITCPSDLTVECIEDIPDCDPDDASATDNCDEVTISCSVGEYEGDACGGTISYFYTAVDECGNTTTCERVITIIDTTPPEVTCPADKVILCGQAPTFDAPTVGDNCDDVSLLSSTASSSLDECGNGTFSLVRVYTDECGNTTSCTQNITLDDCGDLELIKTTNDAVDASRDWQFSLSGYGPRNTFGVVDGILYDEIGPLSASQTYTICETNVMAGWTSNWWVYNVIVVPVNPDFPEDFGVRCIQVGVDTPYPLPVGDTENDCILKIRVDNSYPGGEPRTPGYWKNWNRCSGGGQEPNAERNGGYEEGFWLLDDILNDPGISWGTFVIDDCLQAVAILDQRDFCSGKKKANDAAFTLAMSLLAAQLNFAAGAATCPEATEAAIAAEQLLIDIEFNGCGDYLRPNGKTKQQYYDALELATTLDYYNNGTVCNSGGSFVAPVRNIEANGFDARPDLDHAKMDVRVYPNPSSSDVTIGFTGTESTVVTIDIFDLRGALVKRIFDAEVEEGVETTTIIPDQMLSAGTYIYRLSTGKEIHNGKFIIIE